ncbi:MAG: N-acetylneuraminate synthase family protein [Planctomycetes bacterium]|nr:N-acetylneuraminate synthase family protein [Planctomycetota bacterium]
MVDTWLRNPETSRACTVIAEVAQAHDGSLGTAHAYVDCAARAGADAIKFQTHIADAESTPAEPWRTRFSPQDETRFDYWKRMEFTEPQWGELARHARDEGLLFLSSPFSLEAVDLLTRVGVAGWKVASGEMSNFELLDAMAATGLPVLLSSGMSDWDEIDRAVTRVREQGCTLGIFQCTSAYPCPPERLGLNVIGEMRTRYGCAVGLSDHTGAIWSGLAAATQSIQLLEVHLAFSRDTFGPDVPSSVTPSELAELVRGLRAIETAVQHPVDKSVVPDDIAPLRKVFMKSIVAAADLAAGTCLERAHLAMKKPGTGIPADRVAEVLGHRLKRDLARNAQLTVDDLDPLT